jgi:hypothetical protein
MWVFGTFFLQKSIVCVCVCVCVCVYINSVIDPKNSRTFTFVMYAVEVIVMLNAFRPICSDILYIIGSSLFRVNLNCLL